MRRRWILTIAVAIALIVGLRVALDAVNGPSSPAVVPLPGASGSGAVENKRHCDQTLSTALRRASRTLSRAERRALPRTIGAVCTALPGTTRLEVAAREVLTIVQGYGTQP